MSQVKGWCPSAHRPMMSGDGLIVRISPPMSELSPSQTVSLSGLSLRYGNGMIDLTSRANLQVRGVSEAGCAPLLDALIDLGLASSDPAREERLTVTPFWQAEDINARLGERLADVVLPPLPDKMGIVLDAGPKRLLDEVSGDFRFERSDTGTLMLRADGAERGRPVGEDEVEGALQELAVWFCDAGGATHGRMRRLLSVVHLPEEWQVESAAIPSPAPQPGQFGSGCLFGVAFGQMRADALQSLVETVSPTTIRVTPWRMLFLDDARACDVNGFINAQSPLMAASACPGQPACTSATVETRDVARALAGRFSSLHVSGCSKGCARQAAAEVTLVGRDGRFDLVRKGRAGDTPVQTGLSTTEALELVV